MSAKQILAYVTFAILEPFLDLDFAYKTLFWSLSHQYTGTPGRGVAAWQTGESCNGVPPLER